MRRTVVVRPVSGGRRPYRHFGSDVIVRHIIGLDPARRGVAVSDQLEVGMQLAFCQRNVQAAKPI